MTVTTGGLLPPYTAAFREVDLKTKDGIKSDTDGTEFGGSVELGYDYAINKTLYLTPSVGAFYTQVDYDDATDSAGKIAKYNTLRQLELEAGVKLTKAFVMDEGYANVYVKPSVVQHRLLTATKFGSPVWAKSTRWMTRRWAGLNSAVATASPNSCRLWLGQPHLRRRLQSLDRRFRSQLQLVVW